MVGSIAMWSGLIANIPTGWVLCDGSNSTPDLRERFVIGVSGSYALNATGGANSVALTINQIPSHSHDSGGGSTNGSGTHVHGIRAPIPGGSGRANGSGTGSAAFQTISVVNTSTDGDHSHTVSGNSGSTGLGQAHENRPPYYALAFIMAVV